MRAETERMKGLLDMFSEKSTISDAISTPQIEANIDRYEEERALLVKNHAPVKQIDRISERIRLYRGILAEREARRGEGGTQANETERN